MITVYWTKNILNDRVGPGTDDYNGVVSEAIGIRAKAPVPVNHILEKTKGMEYHRCPAFRDYTNNLFSLNAPFDYDLYLENGLLRTNYYDQFMFDKFVRIRSIEDKLVILNDRYLFLTESDDLQISVMHAHLSSNDFIDNTVVIPGTVNIAKWPRFVGWSFHMKNERLSFKEDDTLAFIKFHTNEKIEFKYFQNTQKMMSYQTAISSTKRYKNSPTTLEYFYNLFASKKSLKAKMLKEARENVLD